MSNALSSGRRVRKLMLYSHATYGLGHLRRNLGIANHLLESADGLQIVLVSGSPVSDHFPTPAGLTIVNLPSVHKVGPDQYRPRDPRLSISLVRRARTAIMSDVARRLRPDVLLVDHSPAGMNGELLGVFETLRAHSPATRVVLGLRDILDEAEVVVRTWTDQGIYPILDAVYHDICVYGCRDLFDVGLHYQMSGPVRDRLQYCGYLARSTTRADANPSRGRGDEPYVLATAGGGGDGASVLAAAIDAGQALGVPTMVVTGPLIDDRDWAALATQAAGAPDVELVRFHPKLRAAMASASAVVTMGGYNSLCEAVSVGVPTIVVPRCHPRLEQTIRARLFCEQGLVDYVPPGPDLASRLASALGVRSRHPRPAGRTLDLGGLDRLGAVLLGDRAFVRRTGCGSAGSSGNDRANDDERIDELVSA
jgi:predicted glycosyltransferase